MQPTEEQVMRMIFAWAILALPIAALADTVTPVDAVETYVNVRLDPDAASEVVGRLRRGDTLPLIDTIEGWHEVELVGGGNGFVSTDWAVVATTADTVPTIAEPVAEAAAEPDADAPVDPEAVEPAPVTDTAPAAESAPSPEPTPADAATAKAETVREPEILPQPLAAEPAGAAVVGAETLPTPNTPPEPGPQGIPGPPGPAGPPGPPGSATIVGKADYLVRFKDRHEGTTSQIFDNGSQVGIGTDEPKQRLEVNGSIQIHERASSVAGLMITQSSGDTGYIMHNRASTLTIGAGSVDRITVDRDGNVGLGVARPTHPLELANGAHVTAGGVWTNSSSRDRKQDVAGLSAGDAVAALAGLEPVTFEYLEEPGEAYVGFIAEDVPDLVATAERDSLSAMDIVAVLTRVVQSQQRRIEALERRLEEKQ